MAINAKYHAGDVFAAEVENPAGISYDGFTGKQCDVWYRLKNGGYVKETDLDQMEKVDTDQPEKAAIERDRRFYNEGRNDGLFELWEALKKTFHMKPDDRAKWFGSNDLDLFERFTPVSFLINLHDYEREKADSEIKAGDEVEYKECPEVKFVVTNSTRWAVNGFGGQKGQFIYNQVLRDELRKTGRHFTEIAEVLKKMQE